MSSVHEQLSAQFSQWEKHGRGWQTFSQPVSPEPSFVPFYSHVLPSAPRLDDGRKPAFIIELLEKTIAPLANRPVPAVKPKKEPEPPPLIRKPAVELQVALPAKLDISRDAMEQIFRSFNLCREPVTFELLGTPQRVLAQFAASQTDASLVRKQSTAHFPDALFREQTGTLEQAWLENEGGEIYVGEFGLEREFMLPLASGKIDPFVGIVSALAGLQSNELALFQVLFQPVNKRWAESIVNSVTDADGKPFFVNFPELVAAAENKVTKPLYAVVVRMLVQATTTQRLHEIAREFAGSLCAFTHPQGNALIPLRNSDYTDYSLLEHINDVLLRQSRRTGMILNSDELFGFVHLPSAAVRTPALARDSGQTKAAPDSQTSGLVLGDNEHNGEVVPVCLSPEQRIRHTQIIGIPGTGKSSLLFNLIRQDIENGDGVAVLDPHGDLVDQILGVIPDDRVDDVVLVDLTDKDFPIGFNILQAHSEDEKALLASDLVAVLRRFSTSWGDQMDIVLQNAILAFLESNQGGTLADLRRFLLETPYRNKFLQTVTDPELTYYWQKVFPQLSGGKSVGSVLTRLQDFFSRKPLRNMVSQRMNKLDFADIMDGGKIFLAKLPEGLNGAENVYLLGSLLVSKFQQTAMARQSQTAANRRNYWLYIDEFDHFISPSMAQILTGARKYRLGLTLAHQELHQLQSEPKVASAVNASVCTRIVLRVGNDDAKKLAEGFASFDAQSLTNLEKFHAIARIERNDWDFNLALWKLELPSLELADKRKAKVIAASRAKYGTPRSEVEAAWLAGLGLGTPPIEPPDGGSPSAQPMPVKPTPLASVRAEVRSDSELPKAAAPLTVVEPPKAKPLPDEGHPPTPLSTTNPGRGSALHKAIQKRIAEAARAVGFFAESEKQLLKGSYKAADVMLQRGNARIGIEIALSGSGTVNHEFENVQKCLVAGCDRVVVVANETKRLEAIAGAVQGGLGSDLAAKVKYQTPDEFIAGLPALAAEFATPPPKPGEHKVGGIIVGSHFPTAPDAVKDEGNYRLVAEILAASRKPKRR
jgi:hypothetical protein